MLYLVKLYFSLIFSLLTKHHPQAEQAQTSTAVRYKQYEFFDRYMEDCIIISDYMHELGPRISFYSKGHSDYKGEKEESNFKADFMHFFEEGQIRMPGME